MLRPQRRQAADLFLARLYSIAVFACHYLDLLRGHDLVRFHLELGVLDYERPDVVAKSVGVEVALRGRTESIMSTVSAGGRTEVPSVLSWSLLA